MGHDDAFPVEAGFDAGTDIPLNTPVLTDRTDNRDDHSYEYFEYENEAFRYIRITNHGKIPANGRFAVSGLRVFGYGAGEKPEKAPEFTAVRCEDGRNMRVTWEEIPSAEGYFVRFGVDENELHTHFQIIGETQADIRCLIKGVAYNVTVDAYNKNGVTRGVCIRKV